MRIAMITAGAAGMYCGSCMHDNTLAAALVKRGHDALLIPTYTPIRTDEVDVSQSRVFFGGINVYLQQKSFLFRYTPWFLDRLWDIPRLLRWVSRFAVRTQADRLGALTLSMLRGKDGNQRKELEKLIRWLETEIRPDVITMTNVLLSGLVPEMKRRLKVPILAFLQGDDIFLESLPKADRDAAIAKINQNCRDITAYFVTSGYYADFMSGYLGLPRERMHVIYPGLNLTGHGPPREFRTEPPFTIGYFARIAPEKGLHNLVSGYIALRQMPNVPATRFRISGWLGDNNRAYFDAEMKRLREAGLAGEVEHIPAPDHAKKIEFLNTLDVLSVPTVYREPKGLYILEALANGVPVIQPRHGSFPELIEGTGGGLLVEPDDPNDLARGLARILTDHEGRREMARRGKEAIHQRFHADRMAEETAEICERYGGSR